MLLASLLALTSTAHAYIFVGNPTTTAKLVLPGQTLTQADAYVDYVRVHKCAGGYEQIEVDAVVDLLAGFTVDTSPGDLCGVSVKWDSDVTFGNGSFDAVYDDPHTSVALDGSPSTVTANLTPFEVTSGTWPGGLPKLVVTVE